MESRLAGEAAVGGWSRGFWSLGGDGETGAGEDVQKDADSKWWPIAPARRPHVKAIVYVADGVVVRVREIDPDGTWNEDDRGYVEARPRRSPAGRRTGRRTFAVPAFSVAGQSPAMRGKIRDYLPL